MRHGAARQVLRLRQAIAMAVLAAIAIPLLLALLPQPALSAAAALERDIAQSLCSPQGPGQDQAPGHAGGHDHCTLCATRCPACAPALAAALPAFTPAVRLPAPMPQARQGGTPGPLQALLDGSPPRGPPALS